MKVAFFGVEPFDKSFIATGGSIDGFEMAFFEETLSDASIEKAAGYDALSLFVHDRVLEASSIERLASFGVKVIALRSAGFNHVNVEACKVHGIRVVSVPSYSPASIAEFAVALLFDLARRVSRKSNDIKTQRNFSLSAAYIGYEIRGRTVAVIGTGKIGKIFAELMQNIGAKVKAYDVYPDVAWATRLGIEYYATVEACVHDADIISLHCPSMPSTYHIMNDHILMEAVTRPVILINTSRGDLVDNEALVKALEAGKVMAAGLDVLEGEVEILKGHTVSAAVQTILDHPNVIFTPHMAYFTREALNEIWTTTLDNLAKFMKNETIDSFFIRA